MSLQDMFDEMNRRMGEHRIVLKECISDKIQELANLTVQVTDATENIGNILQASDNVAGGYSGQANGALLPFYGTLYQHICSLSQLYGVGLVFLIQYQQQLRELDQQLGNGLGG